MSFLFWFLIALTLWAIAAFLIGSAIGKVIDRGQR